MNMNRPTAVLASGFFILASALQSEQRSCRVVFPERPHGGPKSAFLFDGSGSRAITLPSMNFSEVIRLPSGELTIALTADDISDPETLPPDAPSLSIPEELMDFYIILTPDPENKVFPVKMILVNAAAGELNPGETLWCNFTPHRISAKLGGDEMSVDPGGRTVSRNPVPASGYYTAEFEYKINGKGAWAPIGEQQWWHDAKSRHLGLVLNSGRKLPDIHLLRDFRDPEGPETGVPLPE